MLSQYVTGTLGPDTMDTIGVEFKIKEIQVGTLKEAFELDATFKKIPG